MRLNLRLCVFAGLAALAVTFLGMSGHVTALEKLKLQDEEVIELFPALPEGQEYLPYTVAAPSGLPGPTISSAKHSGSVIYPVGYAPADFEPSCCCEPVCEVVCPPKCIDIPKVPVCLSFCNPVTGCKEYIKVCIPACCEGCPKKHFRRAILGYGVMTFSWCDCDYEVKIRIRRSGKIVVKD